MLMQSTKTKIVAFLIILLSIIVSLLMWENINFLPSEEAIKNFEGTVYIKNNYSHWNEILRFIFFICLPSILYLFYLKISNNFQLPFLHKDSNYIQTENKKSNLKLFFFILFLLLLNLLFFKTSLHKIDSLHEGMWLTAGQNFFHYNNFWKNSFITVGWGHEFLTPILTNFIFGELSINGTRFMFIIYQFINQSLLLIFAYQLSYYQKFSLDIKNFIFIFFALVILFLTNFYDPIIVYREIPIVLFLISVWNVINKKSILTNLVFIGLLSSIAIFLGLDRGAYLNFVLLLFCIFQVLNKNLKNLFIVILSIFFGWLSFYVIFGHEEFSNFLNNSIHIYSNMDYIHGIIHPTPFGDETGSSRAGKNLILILLTSFLTIFYCMSKSERLTNNNKIILIFLFVVSIVSYKTGLGRSDGPHMRGAMSWSYISLAYIFLINLGVSLEKKFIKKNYLKFLSLIVVSTIIIFISKIIFINGKVLEEKQLSLISYKKHSNDYYYNENNLVNYKKLRDELEGEECINNLTYEAAIPFVLSKPTCNKFYFPWSIVGRKLQSEYIDLLKLSKSDKILIKKNEKYINNSLKKLLPIIFEHLETDYEIHSEIDEYLVLKRNM
tara:strand:+ start:1153 stop:2979 length:1827 start_codon:yes stop_codon:yes gene_type:complete